MIQNKLILVIGGAGFIGSSLIKSLDKSNQIISLDCYFSGSRRNHIEGVQYVEGYSKDVANLFPAYFFDYIFHFGEYSRVETSFEDYRLVMEFNLESFSNVIEYASKHSGKFIYSGSSTKFGDVSGGSEASPYAWSKTTNTEHLNRYADWFGLNYCIVYFYNVFGENEIATGRYSTLIGKYLELCRQGATYLPVVTPGTQVRNFTYIGDVVNAIQIVAEMGSGDGYGIGAEESHTILDVVNMFQKVPEMLPARRGNRMMAELCTDKTLALGWVPKVDLASYIKSHISEVNK